MISLSQSQKNALNFTPEEMANVREIIEAIYDPVSKADQI